MIRKCSGKTKLVYGVIIPMLLAFAVEFFIAYSHTGSQAMDISDSGEGNRLHMKVKYADQLQKVFTVQKEIQDLHPFLEKVFPIAIVEDGKFFIYEPDPAGNQYVFTKEAAATYPVPPRIRAAFPLDFYDERMACVVTGDVFDEPGGYVTIFHEFIHCYQFDLCEQKIKQTLEIARRAQDANDFMWELEYTFPYRDPNFVDTYQAFLERAAKQEFSGAMEARRRLKKILSAGDYEYMVWQEWKEGFARYIENLIQERLGYEENHYGREQPFSRVSFYEGGANLIRFFCRQEPQAAADIERLFGRMFDIEL